MKTKPFIIILLFAFFSTNLYSQSLEKEIKFTLDTFGIALKEKDAGSARKFLTVDFSISANSGSGAYNLLDIILKNQDFESIQFLSINKESDSVILTNVRIVLQNKQEYQSIVAFDPQARIIFIDYFDRLFGHSRYRDSRLVGVLPFSQNGESIILHIKLNDKSRQLSFLFDTGADGMAIRKTLADSLGLKTSHTQTANVVGGQKQIEISSGNAVHLSDSIILSNQNIAIFEKVRDNTDGIIGLNLIKQYITRIDFDDKLLYLYSFGDFKYPDEGSIMKVNTKQNLISIPGVLDLTGKKKVTGTFIVDTGANYYLIAFSRFVRKNRLLLSGFKPKSSGAITSLGHTTPVYNGIASEFSIGDIKQVNMPVTLQASTGRVPDNSNFPDGSIGIQFFSRYNLTIDLLKKEIHLVPRKIP